MDDVESLRGCCGLDCNGCDMIEAGSNPTLAHSFSKWFREERGIEVEPSQIHCNGCKGDREKHWSPDCYILLCCMDKKGLNDCSFCLEFPCNYLLEWSERSPRYKKALETLKQRKEER